MWITNEECLSLSEPASGDSIVPVIFVRPLARPNELTEARIGLTLHSVRQLTESAVRDQRPPSGFPDESYQGALFNRKKMCPTPVNSLLASHLRGGSPVQGKLQVL